MRVVIDEDLCRGHGVCCALCPDVFELTDGGYAQLLVSGIPTELENDVRAAILQCPERAISIADICLPD